MGISLVVQKLYNSDCSKSRTCLDSSICECFDLAFWVHLPYNNDQILFKHTKRTSLRRSTHFEPSAVKIGSGV